AGDVLADARTGGNGRHGLVGLLRQSVFGRLAGYGGKGYKAPHPHSITFYEVVVSTKLMPFDRATLAQLK
ncbi:MAG: hypothetical protein FJX68_11975, partial [Alphaproteobacteria bacterium]|nr:hypothetical protein [Alphaproteobacteria bacterium]